MSEKETQFDIELTAMAHGGSALGRHGGRTIFVPYTIPGETVRAQIVEERGRVAFAEGVTLLEASADRVYPVCPHFGPGRCGRCQWQHISYDAQLLLKQDVLADQLSRIGGFDDGTLERVLQPILRSPTEWAYLDHMSFLVTADGLALPGAGNARPAVIEVCYIIHPALLDLLQQVQFEDETKIQRVKLARGTDGALMLVLSVADVEDVPEMVLDFTASVNLLLPDNTPVNMIGDLALNIDIGSRTFRVTAGSWIRPNLGQLAALTNAVMDGLALTGGETVLDLYGGVGIFSAAAAERGAAVTLVESYPAAAEDARYNLSELDVTVVEGTAEQVMTELASDPSCVIVDPPSDGLSLTVVDALGARNIPRLVYVSSDPATLGRDAKRLVKYGYQLEHVQPIDLSPQTYYIDCVATFTRLAAN